MYEGDEHVAKPALASRYCDGCTYVHNDNMHCTEVCATLHVPSAECWHMTPMRKSVTCPFDSCSHHGKRQSDVAVRSQAAAPRVRVRCDSMSATGAAGSGAHSAAPPRGEVRHVLSRHTHTVLTQVMLLQIMLSATASQTCCLLLQIAAGDCEAAAQVPGEL